MNHEYDNDLVKVLEAMAAASDKAPRHLSVKLH
jgi:hypothetical protein